MIKSNVGNEYMVTYWKHVWLCNGEKPISTRLEFHDWTLHLCKHDHSIFNNYSSSHRPSFSSTFSEW